MNNQIQTIDQNLPSDMNSFYENKKKEIASCEDLEKLVSIKQEAESISSLLKKRGRLTDRHLVGDLARRAERRLAKIFESKKDSATISLSNDTLKLIKSINKKYSDDDFEIFMKYLKENETYPSMDLLQKSNPVIESGSVSGFIWKGRSGSPEHYTPARFIEPARRCMNGISLDVASSEDANKIVKADTYFTKENSGLKQDWTQYPTVWCNPPFGDKLLEPFAIKFIEEAKCGFFLGPHLPGPFSRLLDEYLLSFVPDERIYFWNNDKSKKNSMNGSILWFKGISPSIVRKEFIENAGIPGVVKQASGLWKEIVIPKDYDIKKIKARWFTKINSRIQMVSDNLISLIEVKESIKDDDLKNSDIKENKDKWYEDMRTVQNMETDDLIKKLMHLKDKKENPNKKDSKVI